MAGDAGKMRAGAAGARGAESLCRVDGLESQHDLRSPRRPDYRQHLEVETPEHVVLDLEIAGIGSRALAALIDMLILAARRSPCSRARPSLAGFGLTLGSWAVALLVLGGFAVWNGYFIFFEGLRRGQTPGKRMVGHPGGAWTPATP